MSPLLQLPLDDRLFVMNLRKGWVTDTGRTTEVETSPYRTRKQASHGNARQEWVLTTYRNTPCLPVYRVDSFSTALAATEYVKWHEPQTPLASLNGQPMFSDDDVDKWERWKEWLDQQGLESCLTGKVHLPHWAKG